MRWLAVVLVALALVAAGCGGGDSESAGSDETTTEETTVSTSTETTTEDSDATGSGDVEAILGDEDCLALAGIGATIAQAFAGAADQTASTEELAQLVDKVPDEIQADVQTLSGAFGEYAEKIKDIGIAPGSTPSAAQLQQLQAAISSLDQKELTAASERIQAWAKENCEAAGG